MSNNKDNRTAPLDAAQKTEPLGRAVKTQVMSPRELARAVADANEAPPRPSRMLPLSALLACVVVGLVLGAGAMLLAVQAMRDGDQTVTPDGVDVSTPADPDESPTIDPAPPVAEPPIVTDPAIIAEPAIQTPTASRGTPGIEGERNAEDQQPQAGGLREGLGGLQRREGAGQQTEGERVVERVIRGRTEVESLEDESGSGTFDSNLVVRQLRLRHSVIRRCYERELQTNPRLAGRVVARFSIQPSGLVSGATATENTTGSPAVASCVVNVVRGLRFTPGPEGGAVTYSFPFVFAVEN